MCNMSAGAFGSYCADLLAVLRNPNDMVRRQSSRSVEGGSGMLFSVVILNSAVQAQDNPRKSRAAVADYLRAY